jgi:hypothetical protein
LDIDNHFKQLTGGKMKTIQESEGLGVLSPWADADPLPARGITERIDHMNGKNIGLFCNSKRAARLMLETVESWIEEHYSETGTSWYVSSIPNVPEIESKNRESFEKWLDSVDGVILAVGD